jgi:glutamate synthase domain-containing protein 2
MEYGWEGLTMSVQTISSVMTPNRSCLRLQKEHASSVVRFTGGAGAEGPKSGHISGRKVFNIVAAGIIALTEAIALVFPKIRWTYMFTLPLIGVGIVDTIQTSHSLRRNFPLVARVRWIAEWLRPKLLQYAERDDQGAPIKRKQRDTINRLAKNLPDIQPFGTVEDVYKTGYRWIAHSIQPKKALEKEPRVSVGGPDCKQPYSSSIFNISAMSYGALSRAAVLAMNKGAKLGGFFQNTGEGGISPFHLGWDVNIKDPAFDFAKLIEENREKLSEGADLVWQIGTGYFGCRTKDGKFDPAKFAKWASLPNVKMIELKLSQGAKPGHGGILPAKKLSLPIAKLRDVPMGEDVISPAGHSAFSTPREMVQFIKQLRDLSGGKPVGFKLCVGYKQEFLGICKAMLETGIYPDFITVDGGEGGTGAAPKNFSDWVGMPLNDGLVFVHNALMGTRLRDKIKIIASGKIFDSVDLIEKIALGADIGNSSRGMMVAVGCIQAQECDKNTCPTGVATQDEELEKGLVVENKSPRIYSYQKNTVKDALGLCAAGGLEDPGMLRPHHFNVRVNPTTVKNLREIYEYIPAGSLLSPDTVPESFKRDWENSSPERFTVV